MKWLQARYRYDCFQGSSIGRIRPAVANLLQASSTTHLGHGKRLSPGLISTAFQVACDPLENGDGARVLLTAHPLHHTQPDFALSRKHSLVRLPASFG